MPLRVRVRWFPASFGWWLDELRTETRSGQGVLPLGLADTLGLRPDSARANFRLELLGPRTWSVELVKDDSRSLVLEFSDHLAVIEAGYSSPSGEELVGFIRSNISRKPIRHVFFSHYHPSYTGGLRAFMAEGAQVVTTPGNLAYVREIQDRQFEMQPDRLSRHPSPVATDSLRAGRYALRDPINELLAYDIGSDSDHTDEYVVFYLPRLGLLFEGDLGWFTRDGVVRASRRSVGLLRALEKFQLQPERMLQSWPVRGNQAIVPFAEFRKMVEARKK